MIENLTKDDVQRIFDMFNPSNQLVMLNIRASKANSKEDSFDDTTVLVYNGNPIAYAASTCDPGVEHLKSPINGLGTAIVMNGHYPDLWALGKHRGRYKALKQVNSICVYRDDNKDSILDYCRDVYVNDIPHADSRSGRLMPIRSKNGGLVYHAQIGYFGINFHRASAWKSLTKIGLYSAGCCVAQNPDEYDNIIDLVEYITEDTGEQRVGAIYIDESVILNKRRTNGRNR